MSASSELPLAHSHDVYSATLLLGSGLAGFGRRRMVEADDPGAVAIPYTPPELGPGTRLREMPGLLMGASMWQMYANLVLCGTSNDPEVVHQARIGWRRLRGGMRMLRALEDLPLPPVVSHLRVLIDELRELRDVDVARYEVIPRVIRGHHAAQAAAGAAWSVLLGALAETAHARRETVRALLQDAAVGRDLWVLALWLEDLREQWPGLTAQPSGRRAMETWSRTQLAEMRRKFKRAQRTLTPQSMHRARIWAKRLRYGTEDFAAFLPGKAKKWQQQASEVQRALGEWRDFDTAARLAQRHGSAQLAAEVRRYAARARAAPAPVPAPGPGAA